MTEKVFRRLIEVRTSPTISRAFVEDDYHRFRLEVHFAELAVSKITAQAIRYPWDLCPYAVSRLQEFVGLPLTMFMSDLNTHADMRSHCTHLFDLASLILALTARQVHCRAYEITIPYRRDGCTTASLSRDGQSLLNWTIDNDLITGPPPFESISLRRGFSTKADSMGAPDLAEAMLVLRRAVNISLGRGIPPLDDLKVAPINGGCFVQNPERAPKATRILTTRIDFSEIPKALGSLDRDWVSEVG